MKKVKRCLMTDVELENFPRFDYQGPRGDLGVVDNLQNPKTRNPNKININQDSASGPDDQPFYRVPNILFDSKRLLEFYPNKNLSANRRLNAIARFLIYFGLLYFFASGYSIILLLMVFALYLLATYQSMNKSVKQKQQTGGECLLTENMKLDRICTLPTKDNPFMNPTVNEYLTNVDRPPACPITEPEVKSRVNDLFMDNLYLDIDDIWEKRNGQREFVTQPNTQIPNDQEGFARWLFDNPNHACRENYICKNDLRFNHTGPSVNQTFGRLC